MWPLDNSNANQSAIDASHSSPRRESSSSPRLDRFLLEVGKWGSAGGSSLSVSEDRFQSERNIVRFRTKFDSRRFFFFFFPHFRRSSLKSLHRIWCRDFLFFFFFWFEILLGISGTRQPPFESKDTRCFFVCLFFFLRLDVSEYFVNLIPFPPQRFLK